MSHLLITSSYSICPQGLYQNNNSIPNDRKIRKQNCLCFNPVPVELSHWSDLYQNSHPENLMDNFTHIIVKALKLHALFEKVFSFVPSFYRLSNDRRKKLVIIEIRNSNTKAKYTIRKNVFKDFVSQPRKTANMLIYRFPNLEIYAGLRCQPLKLR